jgi:hypothetical protein
MRKRISRRQFATAKSVDANLRTGSGELVDSILKLIRVVRKLCDLFLGQNVTERWSIRVCVSYLSFFLDIDVHFDDVDLERDLASMRASCQINIVKIERFEARGLDMDLITTGNELIEACFAALIC